MAQFKIAALVATLSCAAAILAFPAFGKGPGGKADAASSCAVAGNVVSATGLPLGAVINFQYSDSTGTYGWVLGYTDSGSWSLSVPAPSGTATYQFISKTWGPDGSKYDVYASCSS
jgi:hypothetical protein